MKTAIAAATAFLIALSFWCGVRHGNGIKTIERQNIIKTQSELLQSQKDLKACLSMEIARKSQIEWLRQREVAFSEVVAMEFEEMKRNERYIIDSINRRAGN